MKPGCRYLADDNGVHTAAAFFHTTPLSAPSRAALLTGRNHPVVHMGHFIETAFDAPAKVLAAYQP